MTMEGIPLALSGVVLLRRLRHRDQRGSFERLFCAEEARRFGHPGTVAQANRSVTLHPGAIRGLHLQRPPQGEWKLVTCTRGAVHDVVVDVRRGSPTFLRHVAVTLSADEPETLLIPPGFAHGFQVIEGPAELVYVHSHPHVPAAELGLRVDDPLLAIPWPMPLGEQSARDRDFPRLASGWDGIEP